MRAIYLLFTVSFLLLISTIANSQGNNEIPYKFDNSGVDDPEFNEVKLFFRYGNTQPVKSVRISPDAKFLATLDYGGNIVIWDIDSRKQLMAINGAQDEITTIMFTPDSKYLMGTGSPRMFKKDKNYYLNYWDYTTGELKFRQVLDISISRMQVSPDGKKIYSIGSTKKLSARDLSGAQSIQVRDISSGKLLKELQLGWTTGNVFRVSPNGKYLIFGNTTSAASAGKVIGSAITGSDKEGFIQVRDAETGKRIKEFHVGKRGDQAFLQEVLFEDDNNIILIGNFEKGNFIRYNIETKKKKVIKSKKPFSIRTAELSEDRKFIYLSTPNNLIKVDAKTLKKVGEYPIDDFIRSIDFSKDGKFFITGGGDRKKGSNQIRVWDYKTDKQLNNFEGMIAPIVSTVISPKNNDLIIGTSDGQVQILDLTSGKVKMTLNTGKGRVAVKVTNNGRYLVTSTVGNLQMLSLFKYYLPAVIKIWDVNTYQLIDSIPEYSEFIISPDDQYVFVMKGGKMKMFEFKTGKVILEKKILGSFTPVAFNKDATQILTKAAGTFKIRDAKTLKKVVVGKKYKGFKGHLMSVMYNEDETKVIGSVSKQLKYRGAVLEWNMEGEVDRELYKNDSAWVWNSIYNPTKDKILCGIKFKDETGGVMKIDAVSGERLDSNTSVGFPLQYTSEGKHLLSYTDNYKMGISILNANNFQREVSFLKVRGADGYALYTDDYYYTITKNARTAITFIKSGQIYPFEQFDLKFNRPDIIAQRMPYPDENLIKIYNKAYKKRLSKMGIDENSLKFDFNLPIVEVINKEQLPISSTEKNITLELKAKSDDSNLQNMKIWINDVPIYGSKGFDLSKAKSKVFEEKVEVELSEGRNKIQIAVLNANGVESLKWTKYIDYTGANKKHDLYIVAIGVSKYKESKYNLDYAAKDVTDFVEFMQKQKEGFENIKVYKFIDEDATVNNIMKVKSELMNSHVDDEVVVYYAGHGLLDKDLDYFLGMNNVNFSSPNINGLSINDFESLVDGIPSRKKSMFIDACHSGEVDKEEVLNIKETLAESESAIVFRGVETPNTAKVTRSNSDLKNSFELMKETFSDLRRGSGAMIISSAGGGEFALESGEWKNGVFTLSVLQGLTDAAADLNGDKVVSITELADYVSQSVREKTSGLQNPTFRRENLEFDYAFLSPEIVVLGQEETDFVKIVPIINQTAQGNLGNQPENVSTETNTTKKEAEPKDSPKAEKEATKKEKSKKDKVEQSSDGVESSDVYSFHLLKYGVVGAEYEHMVSNHIGVNAGAGILSLMVGAKYHFRPDITSSSVGINMGYRMSFILLFDDESPHTYLIVPYYEYRSAGRFTFSAGLAGVLFKTIDNYYYDGQYYEDKYTNFIVIPYVGVGMYFQR